MENLTKTATPGFQVMRDRRVIDRTAFFDASAFDARHSTPGIRRQAFNDLWSRVEPAPAAR